MDSSNYGVTLPMRKENMKLLINSIMINLKPWLITLSLVISTIAVSQTASDTVQVIVGNKVYLYVEGVCVDTVTITERIKVIQSLPKDKKQEYIEDLYRQKKPK